MTGARAQSLGTGQTIMRSLPTSRASGIHRDAEPVLQCLRSGRKALRRYGRTATEARVRSPSEVSAFQAETERWSGNRTHDPMIRSHLLYQTELSFVCAIDRNRTGPPAFAGALHELAITFLTRRNTKPDTGPRRTGPQRARTKTTRRSALIKEGVCDGKPAGRLLRLKRNAVAFATQMKSQSRNAGAHSRIRASQCQPHEIFATTASFLMPWLR
jgi:hypothetical protein